MKTIFYYRIAAFFAAIFLLTSCIFDNIYNPENGQPQTSDTMVITVHMPGGNPQTRITLTENDLDVDLAWEANDQLNLLIQYEENGQTKRKQETVTVTVTVDSNNPKKATFSLSLPAGNYATFDLFGVYGGDGFSTEVGKEHMIVLPTPQTTLADLQANKAFVLRFKAEGISKANPTLSAQFIHVGSLVKIYLKNLGTSLLENITEIQLTSSNNLPIHRNSGNGVLDITTGDVSETVTDEQELAFATATTDLAQNEVMELWSWLIPTDSDWPEINLHIKADGGPDSGYYISLNEKSGRAKMEPGKAYHFYGVYYYGNLSISGRYTEPVNPGDPVVYDGYTYTTVEIGNQTWMAENLKYLPSVVAAGTESDTSPCYYVYDYNGTDVSVAKATDNYKTYGVLYNWTAAQNACPPGWHLPTDTEWRNLETYLSENGYKYDGTTGLEIGYLDYGGGIFMEAVEDISKSLTAAYGWKKAHKTGALGNDDYPAYRNKSGFTALPSGLYFQGTFLFMHDVTAWWGSDMVDPSKPWVRHLHNDESYIQRAGEPLFDGEAGAPIRCIKD